MNLAVVASVWLAFASAANVEGGADEGSLALTDLAAYRAALDGRPDGPSESVTFRELWDHPERFEGRRVRVEAKVARHFRQGAYGTFPPLVETWAVSPSGDPFCLVAPAGSATGSGPKPGDFVSFDGVFLRKIRYQGADVDRLAPLIVGDRLPAVTSLSRSPEGDSLGGNNPRRRWFDWVLGLAAAGLVALVLAQRHLSKPVRRSKPSESGPPPEFVDGA